MSEPTPNDILFAALEFRAAGISVVPVREDGTKAPATNWKQYQERLAEPDEILAQLSNAQGFGIVTGAISGNLEMLELEGRAIHAGCLQEAKEVAYNSGMEEVWEILGTTYVEQTPSGGVHWLYRISDDVVPGNTKLARRPGENGGVDVLAETRGEGGFVVVAPSHGAVHSSGLPWVRIGDSTPASIKTLTMDQRDALHDIFRALDQMPRAEVITQAVSVTRDSDSLLPGDDFNARASWDEILVGWTRVYRKSTGEWMWRRPGKNEGISASTGLNDADNLYIWSTSTNFEAETVYSKFAAYAHLNFGGDYSAAARDLKRLGYGETPTYPLTPEHQLRPLSEVIDNVVELRPVADDDELALPDRHEQLFTYELENQSIRREVRKHLDDLENLASYRPPTIVRSAADELAMPDEETAWTVFDLMPRGANVLLTAAYKSGKTTMVNNLVKALVDDEPFLGKYGVEPHDGRVVIFNYEVDPRQYRQWLRDMNIRNLDKVTLVHLRGLRMPVTTTHIEDKIVDLLAEYECQTWILDPFARAFVGSGEENSNSDVGRFLDTLDVIKARAGVSNLVMPAHTGRAEEQGITRARGATRLDDHADARWILTKSASGERFFSASGRDVEVDEHMLGFDPDTRLLSVEKAVTRAAQGRAELEERILDFVRAHPRCNAGQLYKGVGGNENEFRIARDSVIARGLLHCDETGVSKLFYVSELRPFRAVQSDVS